MQKKVDNTERNEKIVEDYKQGRPLRLIGPEHGITAQRASQIVRDNMSSKEIEDLNNARKQETFLKNKKDIIIKLREVHDMSYDEYMDRHKLMRTGKVWSIFHDECVACGSTEYIHHVDGYCRLCSMEYYKGKPSIVESQRKSSHKYFLKNRKDVNQRSRDYYAKNKFTLIEYQKDKYDEKMSTPEGRAAYNKARAEYYKENKKAILANQKLIREKNDKDPAKREERLARYRKYYHDNKKKKDAKNNNTRKTNTSKTSSI